MEWVSEGNGCEHDRAATGLHQYHTRLEEMELRGIWEYEWRDVRKMGLYGLCKRELRGL